MVLVILVVLLGLAAWSACHAAQHITILIQNVLAQILLLFVFLNLIIRGALDVAPVVLLDDDLQFVLLILGHVAAQELVEGVIEVAVIH